MFLTPSKSISSGDPLGGYRYSTAGACLPSTFHIMALAAERFFTTGTALEHITTVVAPENGSRSESLFKMSAATAGLSCVISPGSQGSVAPEDFFPDSERDSVSLWAFTC